MGKLRNLLLIWASALLIPAFAHAGCDRDLLGPRPAAFKSLVVDVTFSEALIATVPPAELALIKSRLERKVIYGIEIENEPGRFRSTRAQSIFEFRSVAPFRIVVESFTKGLPEHQIQALISDIARAAFAPKNDIYEIKGGFLKGFNLSVDPYSEMKLRLRHETDGSHAVFYLKKWTDGKTVRREGPMGQQYHRVVVESSPHHYYEIMFSWTPEDFAAGAAHENDVPFVRLVTAFATDYKSYQDYVMDAKLAD